MNNSTAHNAYLYFSTFESYNIFFGQNPSLDILLAGFFASLILSYALWDKNGYNTLRRGIAYTPPKGISPAMAAIIIEYFKPDNDFAFIAALMSLLSKGQVTITEKNKKSLFTRQTFLITPTHKTPNAPLSAEEEALLQSIPYPCEIGTYSDDWLERRRTFHLALAPVTYKRFMNLNFKDWLKGALPFLATLTYYVVTLYLTGTSISFVLFSFFAALLVTPLVTGRVKSLNQVFPFMALLIFLAFFGAIVTSDNDLIIPYASMIVIFIGMLMLGIFSRLMKVPYAADRQNIEHLLGFKRYLEAVEAPVIKKIAPRQMSRELFEEFLPYAVAMGVESNWIKQYETAMAKQNPHQNRASSGYTGGLPFSSSALSGFSSAAMISALGSALAAASKLPDYSGD